MVGLFRAFFDDFDQNTPRGPPIPLTPLWASFLRIRLVTACACSLLVHSLLVLTGCRPVDAATGLRSSLSRYAQAADASWWMQPRVFVEQVMRRPVDAGWWMQFPSGEKEGPKTQRGQGQRVLCRYPEFFWSKLWRKVRNSPTNMSKGYSGAPELIPKVSRTFDFSRIFGRFEPGSLSTFFQKSGLKNPKIPPPRGPLTTFQHA